MSDRSAIEWTDASWNPVTGCTKVSRGCDHCYAETFAERWRGIAGHPYEQGFDLKLWPERLTLPMRWRRPRRIFVTSMSDLFHARVPFEFVERVWDVMEKTPQHTYQILTKRPDRMARFAQRLPLLRNVWLGTSIEDQERIERADHLMSIDGYTHFISAEPLLGPLQFSLARFAINIDWLIAGGESGPGARPCELDWLRDLREQCREAHVAFFVKQLGGHPDKRGHDKALLDGRLWREMPDTHTEREAARLEVSADYTPGEGNG